MHKDIVHRTSTRAHTHTQGTYNVVSCQVISYSTRSSVRGYILTPVGHAVIRGHHVSCSIIFVVLLDQVVNLFYTSTGGHDVGQVFSANSVRWSCTVARSVCGHLLSTHTYLFVIIMIYSYFIFQKMVNFRQILEI